MTEDCQHPRLKAQWLNREAHTVVLSCAKCGQNFRPWPQASVIKEGGSETFSTARISSLYLWEVA